MDALIDYLEMGGYWRFVWPAYGITALVLIGILVSSLRSLRMHEAALARLESERPRRRRRGKTGEEVLNDA